MLRHRVLIMMIPLTVMSCSGKKSSGSGGGGSGSGSAKPVGVSLDTLTEGGKVRGFTAVSL